MTDHELGDAPIEPEYREKMYAIASALDVLFNGEDKHPNKTVGFVLLVFPFGYKKGRSNFISNGARREDIIVLFKEIIARFEGQPEMKGSG